MGGASAVAETRPRRRLSVDRWQQNSVAGPVSATATDPASSRLIVVKAIKCLQYAGAAAHIARSDLTNTVGYQRFQKRLLRASNWMDPLA
jgi:hypothetical protein